MSYPVLCGAVVLTSANNTLRWTETSTTVTATIPAGTYYLRGNTAKNWVTQSENFAAWSASLNVARLINPGASPAGNNAYLIDAITAASSSNVAIGVTLSSSGTKTVSVYLKKGTAAATDLNLYDSTALVDRHLVRVTWSSAGIPTLSTVIGSGTLYTPTDIGSGWYRVVFTAAGVVSANTNSVFIYPATISAVTGSVFAWGIQVEDGASAGSDYVATTGAATTGPTDDLALALVTALNSTSITNIYGITVARSIDPSVPHTRLTISRVVGTAAFSLNWTDALTTLDRRLFGFLGDDGNVNTAKTSTVSCAANWVGNDVAREIEPYSDRIVSVPRAASGRVQGVSRSSRMQSWRLGLSFVDERRMLIDRALSAPSDTLEGFLERFGAGASFELHEVQGVTGTTLDPIHNVNTLTDVVHFSEDTLTGFRPQRIGPGVPLYSADLIMHAKV